MNVKRLRDEFDSLKEHILSLNKAFFLYTNKGKYADREKVNSNQLISSQQSLIRELECFCRKVLNVYADNISNTGIYSKKINQTQKAISLSNNRIKPKTPKCIKTEKELVELRNKKAKIINHDKYIPFNDSYWNENKKQSNGNISMITLNSIKQKLNKSNNESNSFNYNNTTNKKLLSTTTSINNNNSTFYNKKITRNSSMHELKPSKLIKNILKTSYRVVSSFQAKKTIV